MFENIGNSTGACRSGVPEGLSPIEAKILESMTATTYAFCPTCGNEAEPWFLFCGECGRSVIKSVYLREQVTSGGLTRELSTEGSDEEPETVAFACMKCDTTQPIDGESSVVKCEQCDSFYEFVECPSCRTAQMCPYRARTICPCCLAEFSSRKASSSTAAWALAAGDRDVVAFEVGPLPSYSKEGLASHPRETQSAVASLPDVAAALG
jgi:hypothetical protein